MIFLDHTTSNRYTQMMMAALPFLPQNEKQFLSTYITMNEIMKTLSYLAKEEEDILSQCSLNSEEPEVGFYHSIRNFCTEQEKEMLDLFFNFTRAKHYSDEYTIMNQTEDSVI